MFCTKLWDVEEGARKIAPALASDGLVIPFQNGLSFALGAAIAVLWGKLRAKSAETFCVPVASGLVAGESIVAAVIAILCTVAGFLGR